MELLLGAWQPCRAQGDQRQGIPITIVHMADIGCGCPFDSLDKTIKGRPEHPCRAARDGRVGRCHASGRRATASSHMLVARPTGNV